MDSAALQEAYNKGRAEAGQEFQKMIPAIGMQVYGEAIRRIEEIHEESLEKEKKLVRGLGYFRSTFIGCAS